MCNDTFTGLAASIACRQLRFGLPVLYRGNSLIVNSEVYHVYSPFCSATSQRFAHCFYYYGYYYSTCYETFLKCSSKYEL